MSRKLKNVILFGMVVPIVALVVVGSAIYWTVDHRAVGELRDALARKPAGWMDSIRTMATLPAEVGALVLPRTEDGDAAALVKRSTSETVWSPPGDVEAVYQRLQEGEGATAADSAVWLAVAADTTLDLLVSAARNSRWQGMDLMLPGGSISAVETIYDLLDLDLRGAGHGLAIRARIRLARDDRRGAYEDLQAIMGLGEHMVRRHPSSWRGVVFVRLAAKELGHYAQVVGDTALARTAGRAEAWADAPRLTDWFGVGVEPDSALALVHDPTLLLGSRCYALLGYTFARSTRSRVRLFGFPKHVGDELDRLATDPDPDLATFARVVARTVDAVNDMSILQRQRYINETLSVLLFLIG